MLRKNSKCHNFHFALRSIIPFALQSTVFEIFHTLGFPIDSNVKISKCYKFCKTWPIAKKSNSLHFSHSKQCSNKVWVGSDENCWGGSVLKIVKSDILQSALNGPQTKLKELGIKSTLHTCTVELRIPNAHPFHSTMYVCLFRYMSRNAKQ